MKFKMSIKIYRYYLNESASLETTSSAFEKHFPMTLYAYDLQTLDTQK